jgi:uncharacterized damage-inducible protein DinB
MITDIEEFIKTFHGQRRRTQWIVDAIPPDKAGWRPWSGEQSPAEIIRCMAAGHLMYATIVAKEIWSIEDYETLATGWEESLDYFNTKTEEALDLLRPLPNSVLKQKRRRPDDDSLPIAVWRFLLALLEHEIHYRSELNTYLMLMNLRRPRLGGMTIEAVRSALRGHEMPANQTAEMSGPDEER